MPRGSHGLFRRYVSPADLPDTIAIFPLAGALLLPRGQLPLNIFEPRYLAMVDDAMRGSRLIGMVQPRGAEASGQRVPIYDVGCVGRITSYSETDDARFLITLSGLCRYRIESELSTVTPYRQTRVHYEDFRDDLTASGPALPEGGREQLLSVLRDYLAAQEMRADWDSIERAPTEQLVNALATICPFEVSEKQALLEAPTLEARAETLIALFRMASPQAPAGPAGSPVQ